MKLRRILAFAVAGSMVLSMAAFTANAEETTDTDQESIVDYNPSTLKILLDVYEFNTINDVNYDNVYVKDESHYTLSHKVFYEEHPEPEENNPNPPPQYWIQFIAVDDYGNTTKKVQHVVFKVEPKRSEVLDFSELVR